MDGSQLQSDEEMELGVGSDELSWREVEKREKDEKDVLREEV